MSGVVPTTADAGRLARLLWLEAHPGRRGHFTVSGGAEPHVVTFGPDGSATYDCYDYAYRRRDRKHVVTARLRGGEPAALRALRAFAPPPASRNSADLESAALPRTRAVPRVSESVCPKCVRP